MKTMYKVETRDYADCEGRTTEWAESNYYYKTLAEAEEVANKIEKTNWNTGDWRIIETTMDEETFTIVDKEVKYFNYYNEVYRFENAERTIACAEKEIEKLEASKKNCKTELGLERKQKQIDEYKNRIENAKAILAERK